LWHNRTYSLSFADGPYGMLLPSTYFDRNPGLDLEDNIKIGFQPEIGSVSTPSYKGMLRFLSLGEVESGVPCRNSSRAHERAWDFHKFLPWTSLLPNNETYDHVYAYFAKNESVKAVDWSAAAQIAAHVQYQNLFNGFIRHIFEYTTACVMWKSQSPWPALRGFLYDWFLETTGTLRGVRAALEASVSIIFDPQLWQLYIVNRHVSPLFQRGGAPVGARYVWIDLHGSTVASREIFPSKNEVPTMSSIQLGSSGNRLKWPSACTDVCFLRIQMIRDGNVEARVTWHWLTDPALGDAADFSPLGELRQRQEVMVGLELDECIVAGGTLSLGLSINVLSISLDVLFYPTLSLYRVSDDLPLLPLFDSRETDVVILPGTQQKRTIKSPAAIQPGEVIRVILSSWNAAEVHLDVCCSALDELTSQALRGTIDGHSMNY